MEINGSSSSSGVQLPVKPHRGSQVSNVARRALKRKPTEQLGRAPKRIKQANRYPLECVAAVLRFTLYRDSKHNFLNVWTSHSFLPKECARSTYHQLGVDDPNLLTTVAKSHQLVSDTTIFQLANSGRKIVDTLTPLHIIEPVILAKNTNIISIRHLFYSVAFRLKIKSDRIRRDFFGDWIRPNRLKGGGYEHLGYLTSEEYLSDKQDVGYVPMVESLITQLLDTDPPKITSHVAMWWAIRLGKLDVLQKIIQRPCCDPNQVLVFAALSCQHEALELLLKNRRINSYYWDNAIDTAICEDRLEVIPILLSAKRFKPHPDAYALHRTVELIEEGHQNIVIYKALELILRDGRYDPSGWHNAAIKALSRAGHVKMVKLLLADKRVDPLEENPLRENEWGSPIRQACCAGQVKVIRVLLKDDRVASQFNPNQGIQIASECGQLQVLQLFLKDERADPSANGNSAIRVAVSRGHFNIVRELVQDKRVYEALKKEGSFLVMAKDHFEFVKTFLRRTGNSQVWQQAFFKAVQENRPEIVELLLKDRRVDPTAQNNAAFRHALQKGFHEIGRLLARKLLDDR